MVLIRLFEEETERQYKKARIGGYCHLSSGPGGRHRRRVLAARRRRPALHLLPLARLRARARHVAGRGDGGALRPRGGLRPRARRIDAPRRHRARLPRRLGHRGRPAPARGGRRFTMAQTGQQARCCASSARARSTSAPGTSRSTSPASGTCPSSTSCINNVYGMGTTVEKASAEPEVHKRAAAFRMLGERVDGQDLEAVTRPPAASSTARPRGAQAGRARVHDLPLPRPLRRRRRLGVPHEGGDRGVGASATRSCLFGTASSSAGSLGRRRRDPRARRPAGQGGRRLRGGEPGAAGDVAGPPRLRRRRHRPAVRAHDHGQPVRRGASWSLGHGAGR